MAALSAICCIKLACHFKSGLSVVLAWMSWLLSQWFVKSASSEFILPHSNSTPAEGLAVQDTSIIFLGGIALMDRKDAFHA